MKRQQRHSAIDLEEIAPNRFLVHNQRAWRPLKGEGTIDGRLFELTTWRREGLLARLRERGFRVRTLADLVAALPSPPPAPPIGNLGWRPLTSPIEQISHFDLRNLRWHPLTPERRGDLSGVSVYAGWVLRRRKGRGASSYYLALNERGGGIALKPLDETDAVLAGYAQAVAFDARPLLAEWHGDQVLLPDVELPPPYRTLLRRTATESDEGLLVDERAWPLAQELFERLGVHLARD
ncbi:MAG TPA: hypothetical protein VGJ87_18045 [Roseiflexaceae bacterium]|jgi:hypothetical protein